MRKKHSLAMSMLMLILIMSMMVLPVSAAESSFKDVPKGKFYTASVERWSSAMGLDEQPIISGSKDASGKLTGYFKPNGNITRGEMATILARTFGLEEGTAEFKDVDKNRFYAKPISACADAGIITGKKVNGVATGYFEPEVPVTRQDAFLMIARAIGMTDITDTEVTELIGGYSDFNKVGSWAKKATALLVKSGAVSGTTPTTLSPTRYITRGEVTTILDRLFAVYVDSTGEVSTTNEAKASVVVIYPGQEKNVKIEFKPTTDAGEDSEKNVIVVSRKSETTSEWEVVEEIKTAAESSTVVVGGETTGTNKEVDEENNVWVSCDHESIRTNCAASETVTCEGCGDEVSFDADVHKFVDGNCEVCGMAETKDAMKFHANITSHGESVDVNVTNDYAAKMVITPGKVDASKATVTVEMQDVASMGVTGIRKEEKTFETGLTGDPELKVWLSEAFDFEGGKINATIEDKATLYNVTGAKDGNNAVITATPADVDATRAAWAELTSHIDSETKEVEDSYIVVANGSYMVVGNDMLSFEKGNVGDLTLDAFSTKGGMAALEKEIRDKVQLNTSDVFAKEGYEFQFYLAAGTKLAVSNSVATLADDCFITVNADSVAKNAELDKILPELQAAEGGYAMAEKLVKLLNQMIGCVDGDTIDVNITFSEPEEEKDTKFYFGVTANNADGKGTTTVDMEVYDDYSLEINLPMNEISASEVTLDVEMNNVASLGVTGTKKHSQTVNTGMTATGDLNFWMSNAPKFEKATINATIADGDGEAKVSYALVSDMDADWVTITGTTDTEAARTAWAKITNNVATGENEKGDDSYILVNKNSFVQIGTEMLEFEDGADDMLLDNFSNLNAVKQEIKDSVKLVEANEDKIVLYVGAGTTLAVSESVATLEKDAKIVVSASNAIPEDTLSKIQAAADDNNALVKELFTLLNNMIGSMNNGVVDVQISFLEPVKECDHSQERRTNCAVAETAYCECGAAQFDLIAIPHTFENEVCNVCGMTEDEAMKFEAKISSNGNYVETVVTNDYAAQVTVTPGNVDASKVDLYVAMQDVASLDVTGKREESKSLSTGLSGNPALNVWLSNAFGFTSGKIEATVEGLPTGYELKGASVDGNAVITATPVNVEHTRAAWEELTKFVTTESQSSSDSYVEIANGSFMIVGDDMLSFEDDVEGNLKLDGFTANNGMDSVENEIRSKVKLTTDASLASDDYEAKFYLAKGTKLAISNSIATIDENCVITLWGDGLKGEDFANILPELQKAESGYAMAEKLVKMINAMIGSANGNTVGIDITFIEQPLKAPVVIKVEAIDVTPVYSANTVVVEEVVEETTEEPVVEEVVEEAAEEPAVEEVVEEETTEEPVVEEVVEEAAEEPVVEEVVEEETTEEPVVEEVVEEAAEEPAAE